MGAFVDYNDLKSKMNAPSQSYDYVKRVTTAAASLSSYCMSGWTMPGNPRAGSAPAASAVCNRTTVGALGQLNPTGGDLRMWVDSVLGGYTTGSVAGVGIQFIDRLVHMGGLNGTLTTAQTVSTSALTRSTGGARCALEIYTAIGATGTTATLSYTNQAGTAGRTSQPVSIGAAGRNNAAKFLPIQLQAGDTLVQAVASLTLAATTGTVGNFGVTLYEPLTPIMQIGTSAVPGSGHPLLDWGGWVASIPADACVMALFYTSGALTLDIGMGLNFMEV